MDKIEIKILGSGCAKCITLAHNTQEALSQHKIAATVTKVTDITQIMNYGVMITPALVINEKVCSRGKLLKKDEIIHLIKQEIIK